MKTNCKVLQRETFVIFILFFGFTAAGQKTPVYENLPVGKFSVGFKIITLTDESRVTKPEYNYMGEKSGDDRSRKITIHIWYPARAKSGKRIITYGDYCYNSLLTSTGEPIDDNKKNGQLNSSRESVERWFGKTNDEAWKKLVETGMLAQTDAIAVKEKFPLLIGMLRPLSTSVTNELLASNGYLVAMVKGENANSFSEAALKGIPDMQFVLNFLKRNENIDINKIGTFGFSGSGFVQVLFAMYDYRIKALADIESGIYMEGLHHGLSASNYYDPSKLRAPFLHIFSRDLSKQEKYIGEFENKSRYSKRYRLILNQPALHHWDFASEGYTSCIILKNRGAEQENIRHSFETASVYLLNFFNAELKADAKAQAFLSDKATLPEIKPAIWDITVLNPVKPAPDKDEFESIIRTKGIENALDILNNSLKNDTSSNLLDGFTLNNLGYTFLREKKYEEALGIFKLNIELHPGDANFFDSLAEGYELSGDAQNTKRVSHIVMDILNMKSTLTDGDKSLKEVAEKRLNK